MEQKELKYLLEKYWKAETTLEEERFLKDFFASNLSQGFEKESELFKYFNKTSNDFLNKSFDEKILSRIEKKDVKVISLQRFLVSWKAAAVVSGIIVATLVLKNPFGSSNAEMADTFDNPKDAYEATKEALMIISTKMNRGREATMKLGQFSEAQEKVADVDFETADTNN
ncbi:MAG: hypothetical protein RJQ09_03260 [Cyclobacteriaceae bacterium]